MATRFLAWVAGWSVVLWGLIAGATLHLDPFGTRATGRTSTCAAMHSWKWQAFERSGARTILVGTSRVGLGMDATPGGALGAATFNLALPGATMPEVAQTVSRVLARGSADSILMGVDFGMFLGARDGTQLATPLAAPGAAAPLVAPGAAAPAVAPGAGAPVVTPGAAAAAMARGPIHPSRAEMRQVLDFTCTPYEFDPRSGTVWWRELRTIAFEKALHLQLSQYARCAAGTCEAGYRASLESLRAVVREATRSNVRLVVFTNPLPAPFLEGIRQWGAGERFERWKRDIAAIVIEEGGANASPVLDFAVFAPETHHGRPTAATESESIAGFLDVSHYTLALGRIVQRRLATGGNGELFGAPLRMESIGRHLERDRMARAAWAELHHDEVAQLRDRRRGNPTGSR